MIQRTSIATVLIFDMNGLFAIGKMLRKPGCDRDRFGVVKIIYSK